jgi:hypothetical protein
MDGDRPSRHGKILGEILSRLAAVGREAEPDLPDSCLTCAFRAGCMPNQMAGTGVVALNCVLGIDKAAFACHHGMRDGEPTKLCVGYLAARLAPIELARAEMVKLHERLAGMSGPDEARADFDAWLTEIDPEGRMDVYDLGRAFAKRAHA